MNITVREWNPQAAQQIGPPTSAEENRLRYVAQSILHGFVEEPLVDTADQARDVIAWAAA